MTVAKNFSLSKDISCVYTILDIVLAMRVSTLLFLRRLSNFQCHEVNAAGQCIYRKRLTRTKLIEFVSNLPKCTIITEACGGAHYFARRFQEFEYEAKLIAPQYVKPFVKSNKDNAADAEAIVEAVLRPNMNFVPIK